MSIVMSPRHEAAIVAYVALYYNCDKEVCWRRIGSAIRRHGFRVTRTVYRGHAKSDRCIRLAAPFFSTTPKRAMAELFVEKDWFEDGGSRRVGNLFTVHLLGALALSTRSVRFTLSDTVIRELRALNGGRVIEKGEGKYTFDEYVPRLVETLRNLVHSDTRGNGEEILVLTDGAFYADSALSTRGFRSLGGGDYETWYAAEKEVLGRLLEGLTARKRQVVLDVDLLRSSPVIRQKRVAWPEYKEFMRRCGLEARRDDKHGFPRVCVEPFDGAEAAPPFFSDCLGMTEPGNVESLCGAHIRHVARLMFSMRDRRFEVSDAFWRRNVACDGLFKLYTRARP
jgi:hypothetical protein